MAGVDGREGGMLAERRPCVPGFLLDAREEESKSMRYGSKIDRNEVWYLTDGCCAYCGISLENDDQHMVVLNAIREGSCSASSDELARHHFQVDHVVPRCQGGKDEITNLVPCCEPCNRLKAGKSLEDFRLACAIPFVCDRNGISREDAKFLYKREHLFVQFPRISFWIEREFDLHGENLIDYMKKTWPRNVGRNR